MPPRHHFQRPTKELSALFAETQHTSDRVAAVACAAFVDDMLGVALSARFVRLGKEWEDRIFTGPSAPLATFSSKIRLGFALGLYGPLTCADLDLIRNIRNAFAHTADPIKFVDPEITKTCNRLTTPHRAAKGALLLKNKSRRRSKLLYVFTAQYIVLGMMELLQNIPPSRPSFHASLP